MNKLSKKFMVGIAAILLFTTVTSLVLNSFLVEKYYLYQKKMHMETICDQLQQELESGKPSEVVITEIEKLQAVVIVGVKRTENTDQLNEELRKSLRDKGIGYQKFWLWDQDYQSATEHGRQRSIYNQEKLNYSLLVEYLNQGETLYAVAMVIPHMKEAVEIGGVVTGVILLAALLTAMCMIAILVRRIIRPLDQIKQSADQIGRQKFVPIEIHTGDELDAVAASMNEMSQKIQGYQKELLDKNRQMEELLHNVAHDLKTPIALIRVYGEGMKDELDDGTFLDTILKQNNRMSQMIETLLLLSSVKNKTLMTETVALDQVLHQILEEQEALARNNKIEFQHEIASGAVIQSDSELVRLIVENLISNAVKYSSDSIVTVKLMDEADRFVLVVGNQTDTSPELEKLWEPFYVGEASRNKDLSGTGLGLTIVKKSAEKIGALVRCDRNKGVIEFLVVFP